MVINLLLYIPGKTLYTFPEIHHKFLCTNITPILKVTTTTMLVL